MAVVTKIQKEKKAIIDLGDYTVTIAPKRKRLTNEEIERMSREDERIWRMIEKDVRKIRAQLYRERYGNINGE